jgi:acyl carrier protein
MKTKTGKLLINDQVESELINYIKNEFVKDSESELTSKSQLLKDGIIDSLSILTLINHIEKQYNLDFYKIDVTRDSFKDISTIAQMVLDNVNFTDNMNSI